LLRAAKAARSPAIYPALMLALNAGMRDAEIRGLQWERLDLSRAFLHVGESKTEAGDGRTIPLNSSLLAAFIDYSKWYTTRFGEIQPSWYVFPFGKPRPSEPTRPMVTLKTSWNNERKKADVQGRWHDNRHTLITDLAESGAGDETIRDIAGHVSKQMLKHYSHIRMEAKRRALEAIVVRQDPNPAESSKPLKAIETIAPKPTTTVN
jgi:integrase